MKHDPNYEPLTAIEEVRRMLGAPRVNISVLWTVVTRLASDLRWALAELDTLRALVRDLREGRVPIDPLDDPEPTYYVAPVGGSDSAEPRSKTEDTLW